MPTKPTIYLLSPTPHTGTVSMTMIAFQKVATSIDLRGIDRLLFTSKQAVKFAYEIEPKCKDIPAIAIGPATKKQIETMGGRVIYTPNEFYANHLADDIKSHFATHSILYLRPHEVSFDTKGYLEKSGINLTEQIIYKTQCLTYPPTSRPPKGSIIIFTSPSTIHCFLKNFDFDASYQCVVIGEATKGHLPLDTHCFVANEPSIESCVKKAMELIEGL